MKAKFFNMAVFLVVLFGMVAFNSCSGTDAEDTTSSDTSNSSSDTTTTTDSSGATTGTTSGGTTSSDFTSSATSTGKSPFCGAYTIDTDFQYQVWNGASNTITTNGDGSVTLTLTDSAKWGGGGLAVAMSSSKYLNLTKVAKLKFTVSGTFPASSFKIYIQAGEKDVAATKYNLSDLSANGLSSTAYTMSTTAFNVEISLPAAAQVNTVSDAFTYVMESGASGYVTISNISWVDSDGNAVDIRQ